MSDLDLCYLSATDALAAFKARKLSPVELMAALIARAEAVEPTVNAFPATYFERALDQARTAEARYMKESFVGRDAVSDCVVTGRRELSYDDPPHDHDRQYRAFTDPAGGSGGDSMTLAITHRDKESGRAVLDCIREVKPKFSPAAVVAEFAALLKTYKISVVYGDRYAGEWPAERFRENGINYRPSDRVKSEIYLAFLPLLNSGKIELLDHPRLVAQLCSLERRTARGGRDSIDHPPSAHDDVINAVAGALLLATKQVRMPRIRSLADPVPVKGHWLDSRGNYFRGLSQ